MLSIFGAQRTDSSLTILVLNKTSGETTDTIALANFAPAGTAQVWQYSSANKSAIVPEADISLSGNSLVATFPGYSMTLLVVPESQGAMTVPQPAITAVANAASYDSERSLSRRDCHHLRQRHRACHHRKSPRGC